MAIMKDAAKSEYGGEKKTWECIKNNLPDDIICYYNREVYGQEFDFCLLIENVGFVIIEVKGWKKGDISNVVNPNEIKFTNGEIKRSPKAQARRYSFGLLNLMSEKYGKNPAVLNMVCYPFISEFDYRAKRLDVVSEPDHTLFSEDIEVPEKFAFKINKVCELFEKIHGKHFDRMTGEMYDIARRHFEPDYADPPKNDLTPYSRLSVFPNGMSVNDIDSVIADYFKGTKQIVFTANASDADKIAKRLSDEFTAKHITIENGDLMIGSPKDEPVRAKDGRLSVFNFEVFPTGGVQTAPFQALNGRLSEEREITLSELAKVTAFNIDQFRVEHAEVGRDIQVKAGAGTGKTYSMVSRIAFLCSDASNSGVSDPANELAMLTFTDAAADNMKSRLKRLFENCFILTRNTRYLEMIVNVEKMHISTIHKFAQKIISDTSAVLGIGTDFNTVSGTYERNKIFERVFAGYLEDRNSPLFFEKSPVGIYDLRAALLEIAGKAYEKGCDIKTLSTGAFDAPPPEVPYFNELIEKVVIETEKEYSKMLEENNSVALSEYMLKLRKCIDSDDFNKKRYEFKYVFIDEFQDTDDAQIEAFLTMRKKLGFNLFIVGDLKQSIYGFRGASPAAFEKMGCEDKNSGWLKYSLKINYRSDRRLLERYQKAFSVMGGKGLLGYDPTDDALIGVRSGEIKNELLTECVPCERANDKAFFNNLSEIVKRQEQRIKEEAEKRELSENERTIAILVRTNSQVAGIINGSRSSLTIESDSSGDLFQLDPSKDLCRLTSALCNPYSSVHLYDLICSNYVNVRFDIRCLVGKSDEEKTRELIRCLDQYFTQIMRKTWMEIVGTIQSEPLLKTLRLIYEAAKPWKKFYSRLENKETYYRVNYELVFEKLSNMNKKGYLTLDSLNNTLHILIATGSEETSKAADVSKNEVKVICLTVHKAKGLEYGTVIMPYTNERMDKLYPGLEISSDGGKIGYRFSYSEKSDKKNGGKTFEQCSSAGYDHEKEAKRAMKEEARILYVAMTRAINNFIWFDYSNANDKSWNNILKELKA